MTGFWIRCAAAALAAQNSATAPSLNLKDVIREAVAHSAEVRAAKEEVRAARARIGQQESRRRPQLGITGNAVRFDDVSTLSLGGLSIEALPNHQEALSIQLSQILDVSNQVGTAVAQAKLSTLSTEYGLTSTTSDVALSATTAFYGFLRANEAVKVSEASLKAYQEQLKTTTRLYEGGVGQKIDVLRAQSQVADAERELVRRQNDRNIAHSRVNDLLGRPLDEETLLSDDANDQNELSLADRQFLIKAALDQRSEVLSAQVDVRAAEKGIKLARASTEPQFSVGVAGNYYPTTSFQYVRQSTAALSINMSVPLFDGGLARERVNEARAQVERAKARQDRVRRDIALEVQNAALDVETARKRQDAARVAVTAAAAARELAQQRYEAQVGLYIEITDAQAALTAALAAQVDADYDLLTAKARLKRAVGQTLEK